MRPCPLPRTATARSTTPLLGDTIGDHLQRTAARFADRPALVSCHQGVRLTYAQARRGRRRRAPAGCCAPGSAPATASGSGRPTASSGWSCSTPPRRSARSSSTSTPPIARTSSSTCCASRACGCCSAPARSRPATTPRWSTRCRPGLDALERTIFVDRAGVGRAAAAASADRERDRRAHGDAVLRRPDQHPVHERDDGLPQGRDAHRTTTSSTTASSSTELLGITEDDASACRCRSTTASAWSWATWGPRARRRAWSSRRPSFEPRRDPRGGGGARASPRSTACRRCSSRCSAPEDFDSFDLTSLRTGIMAGSPCPIEVMKKVVDRMHMAEVAICYGMTETSPVSTQTRVDDPLERRVGTVGRAGPARGDQGHRPGERPRWSSAASRASCARAATA